MNGFVIKFLASESCLESPHSAFRGQYRHPPLLFPLSVPIVSKAFGREQAFSPKISPPFLCRISVILFHCRSAGHSRHAEKHACLRGGKFYLGSRNFYLKGSESHLPSKQEKQPFSRARARSIELCFCLHCLRKTTQRHGFQRFPVKASEGKPKDGIANT